jgi:hypothetical protein
MPSRSPRDESESVSSPSEFLTISLPFMAAGLSLETVADCGGATSTSGSPADASGFRWGDLPLESFRVAALPHFVSSSIFGTTTMVSSAPLPFLATFGGVVVAVKKSVNLRFLGIMSKDLAFDVFGYANR